MLQILSRLHNFNLLRKKHQLIANLFRNLTIFCINDGEIKISLMQIKRIPHVNIIFHSNFVTGFIMQPLLT